MEQRSGLFEGVAESLMQVPSNRLVRDRLRLNDFPPGSRFRLQALPPNCERNGEHAGTDKGPLFIVYPFDSDPELKQQIYYNRSAWQVARLLVE